MKKRNYEVPEAETLLLTFETCILSGPDGLKFGSNGQVAPLDDNSIRDEGDF